MSLVLALNGLGKDLSRYKHDVTHSGVKINKGLNYNGSAYSDLGSAFQTTFRGSFSIGCKFKINDGQPASQVYLLGSVNATAQDFIQIGINTSGKIVTFYESDNNTAKADSASALLNNGQEWWHKLWFVADSTIGGVGGLVLYFDGEPVTLDGTNDGDTSGVTFADYTTSDNLYLGARNNNSTPDSHYTGGIDHLFIYNTVISKSFIADDYEKIRRL